MKTAETRANELFKLVYPKLRGVGMDFAGTHDGWLKLARYVLSLENKWAKVKKRTARRLI